MHSQILICKASATSLLLHCTCKYQYVKPLQLCSISLVPVLIPSNDLYFLIFYHFFVHSCNWGWLVSAGTLRWWPLKNLPFCMNISEINIFQARLLSYIIIKCPSMVFCNDYQGDLKASLAGGVCYFTQCQVLHINYCIRLCHPNKIDLLTY